MSPFNESRLHSLDLQKPLTSSSSEFILEKNKEEKTKTFYTWNEIKKHNTPSDAWLVINQKVYNVSHWDDHPGGSVLYTLAGDDATDTFSVFHSNSSYKYMDQFYIGHLDPNREKKETKQETKEFILAYRKLRTQAKLLGLYDVNLLYYSWKCFSNLCILGLAIYLCFCSSVWHHMLGAVVLGVFYQQCGWLAHDFLHHQVFENRNYGDYAGIVIGDLWQGFSVDWWKNKHNSHHAVPNLHSSSEENTLLGDPDIDTMPLLAWSLKMAEKAQETKFGRFMISYQAIFYFPILFFARISWLIQSFTYVFNFEGFLGSNQQKVVRHRNLEAIALLAHYFCNLALISTTMSILEGIFFFFISQWTCGLLLALVFGVGHNGMAVYETNKKPDFWNLQVSTTRNIKSSPFIDWFMGGLQYQVDHHLFPTVPRHNLSKLNQLVQSFCREHQVKYHETTFIQGTKEVVQHLHDISKQFLHEFPAM